MKRSFWTASIFLILLSFSSCNDLFKPTMDEPVKDYLEYWSSTCQVAEVKYLTQNVEIDGVPNVAVIEDADGKNQAIEIDLVCINPKQLKLFQRTAGGNAVTVTGFSLTPEEGDPIDGYSEQVIDPSLIKITAKLDDSHEGEVITLKGCLWPDNRRNVPEDDMRKANPEIFYETTFIQNTPPDNVMNVDAPLRKTIDSGMHYLTFKIPRQDKNRNKGSKYEIKCWQRDEDNNSLTYIGSTIVSLSDDKDPVSANTFEYYFDEQVPGLYYEYTVQVLGPHGLNSEVLATPLGPGVHQLIEPRLTVLNEFNGLEDEDQFECIEVASDGDYISFTASPANPDETLIVKVDDVEVTEENFKVSGIDQHTIVVTSSKDGCRAISIKRKIRIVKTPEPATFTFEEFNGNTDSNGYEYIEVETASSTSAYTISPTEDGTTVSGTIDGTPFSETDDSQAGALNVNGHILTAVIHKQYCQPVTTTRKIMIAKKLQEPEYTFNPALNGKKVGGYEYLEVSSSTAKASCTIKASSADSSAKVSVKLDTGNASSAATQYNEDLSVGEHTFTVTVSKDYMIPREFTRNIKVDSKLTKPEITCTNLNGKKDASGYEYIEVVSSSSKASYTVTNKDNRSGTSVTTVVTDMLTNSEITPSNNELDAGTPGSPKKYKIVATVKKEGYVDQTTTKFVAVVAKLKTPKITFNPTYNGKGKDSSGYYYIEVSGSSDTVSYTSSSDDINVTVSTKMGGWAKNNTGSLSIGDYDITVTTSCAFQNEATFSTKVKVVEKLKDPAYTCSYLNEKTCDGYDIIEIPATSTSAAFTITSANPSGCTITGKDAYTPDTGSSSSSNFNSSSSNSVTLTLGLGNHNISGTVSNPLYNSHTFTKKVRVVHELQAPNEIIAYDGSTVSPSGTITYNSYSYSVYKIDLNPDGTGELWYRFTPQEEGASINVEDCVSGTPVGIDSEGTLALGPHKLKFTITKDGYSPQYYTKDIYVKGTLTTPEIKSTNGTYKSGNGDSKTTPQIWQFSYISYDSLKCYIKPGNTGNTVEVHQNSETGTTMSNPTTGFGLGYDTTIKLVIIQSREHCESLTTTKYVKGIIKPIKLSYNNNNSGTGMLYVYLSGFKKDKFDMKGTIKVNGHVAFSYLNSNRDNVNQNTWQELGDSGDPSFTITCNSPSDDITVSVSDLRRNVGSAKDDPDDSGIAGECTKSLCDLKSEKSDTTRWVLLSDTISQKDRSVRPKITFNVSE
ncbi:MAG: hypothetical protein IKQ43_09880 [Treponema sp.]|nr:hypothetical protein [Treponema sp.]